MHNDEPRKSRLCCKHALLFEFLHRTRSKEFLDLVRGRFADVRHFVGSLAESHNIIGGDLKVECLNGSSNFLVLSRQKANEHEQV